MIYISKIKNNFLSLYRKQKQQTLWEIVLWKVIL